MQSKSFLKIWLFPLTLRNSSSYKLTDGPITVEHLKCCDWSVHKFIEVNLSNLTEINQIFRIDFDSIHYHLGEISCQIIECKIFWSL